MATLTVEFMSELPHSELPRNVRTIEIATGDTLRDLRPALPLARAIVGNLRDAGYFAQVNAEA